MDLARTGFPQLDKLTELAIGLAAYATHLARVRHRWGTDLERLRCCRDAVETGHWELDAAAGASRALLRDWSVAAQLFQDLAMEYRSVAVAACAHEEVLRLAELESFYWRFPMIEVVEPNDPRQERLRVVASLLFDCDVNGVGRARIEAPRKLIDSDDLCRRILVEHAKVVTRRHAKREVTAKPKSERHRPGTSQTRTTEGWPTRKIAPTGLPGRKCSGLVLKVSTYANQERCRQPQPKWKDIAERANRKFKLDGADKLTDQRIRQWHRLHFGDKSRKKMGD